MSDYEDGEGGEVATIVYRSPNWRFSWWDIAAIGVSTTGGLIGTVGGLFGVVSQGFGLLANEFVAAAAWQRDRKDREEFYAAQRAEQQRMADELERQVGLDEHWLSGDPKPEDLR